MVESRGEAPVESQAILFADISGSTSLYDRLGDVVARDLVAQCLEAMTAEVAGHGGTLVKTIGDEILASFAGADAAVAAACSIQKALSGGIPGAAVALSVRIGIHYGPVIREHGDIFGDAVNVAARITALALPGEILASREATDACGAAGGPTLSPAAWPLRRAAIKGKDEPLELRRIAWAVDEVDDGTRVRETQFTQWHRAPERLLLRYGDREVAVDAGRPSAVLGRGDSSQIPVASKLASRQHARVDFALGRFILADQSVNGTYVRFADGQEVRLQREHLILRGSGIISLGQPVDDAAQDRVLFEVRKA
jgi:class 3 adenylate cyclase